MTFFICLGLDSREAFINLLPTGLTNGGIRVKKANNVILRNLYFHLAPSKKDLLELQYSTNVWIDHNDFSSLGITGDKDTYDGLLDITHVRNSLLSVQLFLPWTQLTKEIGL